MKVYFCLIAYSYYFSCQYVNLVALWLIKLLYRLCMYCDHAELSWISDIQSIISVHKTGRPTLVLDHIVNTRAMFS